MSKIEQNTTALQELLEAVNNLPSGEGGGGSGEVDPIELQSKTVTPTKNVQEVVADNGYDGLSKVTVNAIPSDYIVPSGTKSITANGTVDVKSYANVSVNVPIPNGYIKPSGSLTVTENGTYDVTQKASVSVNVASTGNNDIDALINGSITEISSEVTSIGNYALYYCSSLQSVNFPNVTSIGVLAFYYCISLQSVNFPNVTSIGDSAFRNCSSLRSADFPKVTSIGHYSFGNCTSLTSVVLRSNTVCTLQNKNTFDNCPAIIYVPSNLVSSYKTATNWSNYADRIVAIS